MVEHSFHYIIANDFNYINVTEPVSQLLGSFPEVFRQQMIQLSFISAEISIPRQNIISVDVVKHCKKEKNIRMNPCLTPPCLCQVRQEQYLKRLPTSFFNVYIFFLIRIRMAILQHKKCNPRKNYWRATQKAHKQICSARYLNRKSKELIPCFKKTTKNCWNKVDLLKVQHHKQNQVCPGKKI